MQKLCDIETMRAGGHLKPSDIVAPSPICLPHDGIAPMNPRNCTSSLINGSFNLRRCGQAIETLTAGIPFSESAGFGP